MRVWQKDAENDRGESGVHPASIGDLVRDPARIDARLRRSPPARRAARRGDARASPPDYWPVLILLTTSFLALLFLLGLFLPAPFLALPPFLSPPLC